MVWVTLILWAQLHWIDTESQPHWDLSISELKAVDVHDLLHLFWVCLSLRICKAKCNMVDLKSGSWFISHLVAGTTWRSHGEVEDGCCSSKVSRHVNTAFISRVLLQHPLYWKCRTPVWTVFRWMVLLQQTQLWHQVRHHEEADELYQVASVTHRWAQLLLFYRLTLMTMGFCFRLSGYVNAGGVFIHIIHYKTVWLQCSLMEFYHSFDKCACYSFAKDVKKVRK